MLCLPVTFKSADVDPLWVSVRCFARVVPWNLLCDENRSVMSFNKDGTIEWRPLVVTLGNYSPKT